MTFIVGIRRLTDCSQPHNTGPKHYTCS